MHNTKKNNMTKTTYPWDGRHFGKDNKELVEWWESLFETDRKNIYKLLQYKESETINNQKYSDYR